MESAMLFLPDLELCGGEGFEGVVEVMKRPLTTSVRASKNCASLSSNIKVATVLGDA